MSSRKDHFLITGSTGFVGTHVCDILNETGQRYSTISHSNLLKPDHKVRELIEKSDAIIYLAGLAHRMDLQGDKHASLYTQANVVAPGLVAHIARKAGLRRFVYVSTVKVHGETSGSSGFKAGDPMNPSGVYAESKSRGELALARELHGSSTELIVVRPPLVYGAGVRGNLLRLMNLIRKGWPLPFGGCHGIRSLISASNLAECLIHLASCSPLKLASGLLAVDSSIARNHSYYAFLPSDLDVSTSDLLGRIIELMGSKSKLIKVPSLLFRPTPFYSRMVASLRVDSSTARGTGWKNRVTPDEGLKDMVTSFLAHESP